jgi:hypothetical protein
MPPYETKIGHRCYSVQLWSYEVARDGLGLGSRCAWFPDLRCPWNLILLGRGGKWKSRAKLHDYDCWRAACRMFFNNIAIVMGPPTTGTEEMVVQRGRFRDKRRRPRGGSRANESLKWGASGAFHFSSYWPTTRVSWLPIRILKAWQSKRRCEFQGALFHLGGHEVQCVCAGRGEVLFQAGAVDETQVCG